MIALIGNATEDEHDLKNRSAFIDAKARIVVRVSKMCNYDTGKTGSRCDWVFLNPNPLYWEHSLDRRHQEKLFLSSKIIITYPPPGCPGPFFRYEDSEEKRFLYQHPYLEYIPRTVFEYGNQRRFTTFAYALYILSRRFPKEQIGVHGCITKREEWNASRKSSWHTGVDELALYEKLSKSGQMFRIDSGKE